MVKYKQVMQKKESVFMKRCSLFLLSLIFMLFLSSCSTDEMRILKEENLQLKQ